MAPWMAVSGVLRSWARSPRKTPRAASGGAGDLGGSDIENP